MFPFPTSSFEIARSRVGTNLCLCLLWPIGCTDNLERVGFAHRRDALLDCVQRLSPPNGAICSLPAKRAHHLILDERRYFPNLPQHDLNYYVLSSNLERAKLEACCALR